MNKLSQLLEIETQKSKIEALRKKNDLDIYKDLLEDLEEKEKNILEGYGQKHYHELLDLIEFMKSELNFDLESFYILNVLKNPYMNVATLKCFYRLQYLWEFMYYQSFSALTLEETKRLPNNPYFKIYQEAFLEYQDWMSLVYHDFNHQSEAKYQDYENHEVMSIPLNDTAYEEAIKIIAKKMRILFIDLINGKDKEELQEEKLKLFQYGLRRVKESYRADIWELLMLTLLKENIDVDQETLSKVNAILSSENCEPLSFDYQIDEEELKARELLEYPTNRSFSFKEMKQYDELYEKFKSIDAALFKVYQAMMISKLKGEPSSSRIDLKKQFAKLNGQEDILCASDNYFDFCLYLRKAYFTSEDCLPFEFLKMIPENDQDKQRLETLVLHRIVNRTPINKDDPLNYSNKSSTQTIEEEINAMDVEKNKQLLYILMRYVLGQISEQTFYSELENLDFDIATETSYQYENALAKMQEAINNNFYNILLESNEQTLAWYAMFLDESHSYMLVQTDFDYRPDVLNINGEFYEDLKEIVIEDAQYVIGMADEENLSQKEILLQCYLKACKRLLKKTDQALITKMCEKEDKWSRKRTK